MFNTTGSVTRVSGKVQRISLLTRISCWRNGKLDGKDGLPYQTVDGEWTSPFLCGHMETFSNKSAALWGRLQSVQKKAFEKINTLQDEITNNEKKIELLQEQIREIDRSAVPLNYRYPGEEDLEADHIQARRQNENNLRKREPQGNIAKLSQEISDKKREIQKTSNRLREEVNTLLMKIETLAHYYQRVVQLYWRRVLKFHPDKSRMPATYMIPMDHRPEFELYSQLHPNLMGLNGAVYSPRKGE